MMGEPRNYEQWEASIADSLKTDALWTITAYRLALFAGDLGWHDVSGLTPVRALWSVADQLYRALGSISANIAEGYSRSTGRDRARFYEYALGSARESRDWYFKARHVLGEDVYTHRIDLLTRIIQLLIKMVSQQRPAGSRSLRESAHTYKPDNPTPQGTEPIPYATPES
jgi:four helix bundle protein